MGVYDGGNRRNGGVESVRAGEPMSRQTPTRRAPVATGAQGSHKQNREMARTPFRSGVRGKGAGPCPAARRVAVAMILSLWATVASAGSESKPLALSFTSSGVTFANLATVPSQVNGSLTYCSNCTASNPCSGGGGG